MAPKLREFLVAHTAQDGRNVGQATVKAANQHDARDEYSEAHPDRVVTVVTDKERART